MRCRAISAKEKPAQLSLLRRLKFSKKPSQ